MADISPAKLKQIKDVVIEDTIYKYNEKSKQVLNCRNHYLLRKNKEIMDKIKDNYEELQILKEKERQKKENQKYIKKASIQLRLALNRSTPYLLKKYKTDYKKENNKLTQNMMIPKKYTTRQNITGGPNVKSYQYIPPNSKKIQEKAASIIQKNFRNYLFRKTIKANYTLKNTDIMLKPLLFKNSIRKKKSLSIKTEHFNNYQKKLFSIAKINKGYNVENIVNECKSAINSTDNKGNTALYYAVNSNNFGLTNELLRKGAKVNTKNEGMNTALHLAMKKNLKEISELLISHNANINILNDTQKTPLMLANKKLIESLGF